MLLLKFAETQKGLATDRASNWRSLPHQNSPIAQASFEWSGGTEDPFSKWQTYIACVGTHSPLPMTGTGTCWVGRQLTYRSNTFQWSICQQVGLKWIGVKIPPNNTNETTKWRERKGFYRFLPYHGWSNSTFWAVSHTFCHPNLRCHTFRALSSSPHLSQARRLPLLFKSLDTAGTGWFNMFLWKSVDICIIL